MQPNKSPQILIVMLALLLGGCTPAIHPQGLKTSSGEIRSQKFITADGVKLPLRQWQAVTKSPAAVIIALHGFNDYSRFFQQPAQYFQQRGIVSYAYDLRGFGGSRTVGAGLYALVSALVAGNLVAHRAVADLNRRKRWSHGLG